MNFARSFVFAVSLPAWLTAACSDDSKEPSAEMYSAAVRTYADNAERTYADVVAQATDMHAAILAFVANPNSVTLEAAKQSWLKARDLYGQAEVYRFYGGPIDDEEIGPEGRINGWPLDENTIDYVVGAPDAGIINAPEDFPEITKELLAVQNERDGEKNLTVGYHAIEFLLWGQDLNDAGFETQPGRRPATDYALDPLLATAANGDRRRTYLQAASELLLEDLRGVADRWKSNDASSYHHEFVDQDNQAALNDILTGMGMLASIETSRERMNNAYELQEQEEEHSCFSDNTHADLVANVLGIENIYEGRYGNTSGTGIRALLRETDVDLAVRFETQLQLAKSTVQAIPQPFDRAILGDNSADGRIKIKAAIEATQALGEQVVEIAKAFGILINLES